MLSYIKFLCVNKMVNISPHIAVFFGINTMAKNQSISIRHWYHVTNMLKVLSCIKHYQSALIMHVFMIALLKVLHLNKYMYASLHWYHALYKLSVKLYYTLYGMNYAMHIGTSLHRC